MAKPYLNFVDPAFEAAGLFHWYIQLSWRYYAKQGINTEAIKIADG